MKPFCLFVMVAAALSISITGAVTSETNSTSTRDVAQLYARHCSSCHGSDGRSRTVKGKRSRSRDLSDPAWQSDTSDERLFNSIMHGKQKMPGFSKKLSEQDIDALVSYVRTLKR